MRTGFRHAGGFHPDRVKSPKLRIDDSRGFFWGRRQVLDAGACLKSGEVAGNPSLQAKT